LALVAWKRAALLQQASWLDTECDFRHDGEALVVQIWTEVARAMYCTPDSWTRGSHPLSSSRLGDLAANRIVLKSTRRCSRQSSCLQSPCRAWPLSHLVSQRSRRAGYFVSSRLSGRWTPRRPGPFSHATRCAFLSTSQFCVGPPRSNRDAADNKRGSSVCG